MTKSGLITTLFIFIAFILFSNSCQNDPTCTDGIQNGGETGIDCYVEPGGPCPQCETNPNPNPDPGPTDSDTLTSLSCSPTAPMCAKVDSIEWSSFSATATSSSGLQLTIAGSSAEGNITIDHNSFIQVGSYPINSTGATATYEDLIGTTYSTQNGNGGGNLIIETIDFSSKIISGQYAFKAFTDTEPMDSVVVTEGVFVNLTY